ATAYRATQKRGAAALLGVGRAFPIRDRHLSRATARDASTPLRAGAESRRKVEACQPEHDDVSRNACARLLHATRTPTHGIRAVLIEGCANPQAVRERCGERVRRRRAMARRCVHVAVAACDRAATTRTGSSRSGTRATTRSRSPSASAAARACPW